MIVDCAVYDHGHRRPGTLDLEAAFESVREDGSFVWIGLHEPTAEEFEAVAKEFGLHNLAVEDAVKAHQRPKVEVYDGNLFVVLKTARYIDLSETVEFAEIMLFIGDGYVVSVRHGTGSALGEVRRGVEKVPELLKCGPIAVLHAIIDRVIDDYSPVIDGIDNDIQEVEAQVFAQTHANPAERIYKLKRQVLDLYRNVEPLIDPLERLQGGKHTFGTEGDLGPYFRDIYDHLQREVSRIAIQRELLSEVLNVNLTHVSVQQNEDMRRISGWVAIAAVPTLLAGLWGMNFTHMPELDAWWGYPMAIGVIVGISLFLFRYLRSRHWI